MSPVRHNNQKLTTLPAIQKMIRVTAIRSIVVSISLFSYVLSQKNVLKIGVESDVGYSLLSLDTQQLDVVEAPERC